MKNINLRKVQAAIGLSTGVLVLVLAVHIFITKVPYSSKYLVVFTNIIAAGIILAVWVQLRLKSNTRTLIFSFVTIFVLVLLISSLLQQYILDSKEVFQLLMLSLSSVIGFSEGLIPYWKKD